MPQFTEKETRYFSNFLVSLQIQLEAKESPSPEDKKNILDVQQALAKLSDGSFGICPDCGDELPYGRLKMHPEILLCLECQPEAEQEFELQP